MNGLEIKNVPVKKNQSDWRRYKSFFSDCARLRYMLDNGGEIKQEVISRLIKKHFSGNK